MHKLLCSILFTLGLQLFSFGQSTALPSDEVVFLEAGGFAGIGSVNYEKTLVTKGTFGLGPRFGLGFNRFIDYQNKFNPDFAIPIALSMHAGNNWKGEFGLGITYSNVVHAGADLEPERQSAMHLVGNIGGRYQNMSGGLMVRIGYSPIFERFNQLRHWGYIGIGYVF